MLSATWWEFTDSAGSLSVLSVTTSPLSFLLSPHSSFTETDSVVSHISCLSVSHKSETSLPLLRFSQILKRSNPNASKCHEWKRTLLLLLLSHTPKHTNSLSSLSPWLGETALQCGQSVWVGFDLSSAAAQLTCAFDSRSLRPWILRKNTVPLISFQALQITVRPDWGVCVCVSECVWRHVLCVHRDEIVTDCRLNYSALFYLMVLIIQWIKLFSVKAGTRQKLSDRNLTIRLLL